MPKYTVVLQRILHLTERVEVEAKDEEAAAQVGEEILEEGLSFEDGECVHATESVLRVELLENADD